MEFTSHRQSWSQAVQTTTSWPAITNGGRSVLRVGCHDRERLIRLKRLRTVRIVEYNMRRSSAIRGTPFFTGPWPMKLTLSTPFRRKHNAKT